MCLLADIAALKTRGVNPLEHPVISLMLNSALSMTGRTKFSKDDFHGVSRRDRRVAFGVLKSANLLED